ncbi:polyunsaturated fatty acid 5-lipoxygenase-like [Watersipora subatra]|uniref:polyunsaturated fatty acid 5-lipoxygenase-like n=1 Tax=Watersipora subatra TaxID=2589382 RepID=UPI00355B8ECC
MGSGCSSSNTVDCHAPPDTTHTIRVLTGDKKGSETNGNIYFCARDEKGTLSEEHHINTKWHDDFEAGSTDVFHFNFGELGRVVEIQIRRDDTAADDEWYLHKVTVATVEPKPESVFPVNRWIHANDTLCISEYDSCLPKDDKHFEQRVKELEKKRALYQLVENIPGAPHQVQSLPMDESFSNDYQWDIQSSKLKGFVIAKYIDLTTQKIKSLEDFRKMFKADAYPIPYGEQNWKSDEEFGNQRLSGCNPLSLRLCEAIPDHFPVTAEMVEPFLQMRDLSDCLARKKIYIVDFRYLADIECSEGRKLPGPTALFYAKDSGDLIPIAIQLMPVPAEDNPVFLPSDPEYTWLAAKMWFNLADASHHQSVTHLGFTHLLMETVCVCTNRQLSPSHPIFKLLAPHFIYLLAIDTLAVNKLVSEGGWVDKDMHIGRIGMFNIIKHNWANWNMQDNGNIINDFKLRGVRDTEALPNYHYRDDALLLWEALSRYVTTVVYEVYDTPEKLTEDTEIQAWVKELASTNMKGLPATIGSAAELAEIVTTFIFTSSVAHAAANFCQYDEYAFTPNYPAILKGEPPKSKAALKEEDVIDCLSTKDRVLSVMIVTKILSQKGTNELGNFEIQYAFDPLAVKALDQLRADLDRITATIDARNDKRTRKYPYLNPKVVPNAISI